MILIRFSQGEERLNEFEILIEECLWHNGIFEAFTERPDLFMGINKSSIQYTLATHQSPGEYVYWRDTRLYTRLWSTVTLTPAYPKEAFPCSDRKSTRLNSSHRCIS